MKLKATGARGKGERERERVGKEGKGGWIRGREKGKQRGILHVVRGSKVNYVF